MQLKGAERLMRKKLGSTLKYQDKIWTRISRGFQRYPEGADRTVGMVMISGINQLGPQKLKFQVSWGSELIWLSYRDIEGSRGFQRVLIEQWGWPL